MTNPLLVGAAAIVPLAIAYYFGKSGNNAKVEFSTMTENQLRGNVEGKDFLIVGGTKGIGYALSQSLAKRGARVTITGRSLNEELPPLVTFVKSDVSTLKGSRDLVQHQLKGRTFDTVVFTVGIFASSTLTRNTEGIEEDLATSYLSRFIISQQILKSLVGRKRMYIMGYPGENHAPANMDDINYERAEYSLMGAHLNTVVFNEALVYELVRRQSEVHVYGLNPGLIPTGIRDNFHGGHASFLGRATEFALALTMPTADQYVNRVLLPLIASPDLDNKSGMSFSKVGTALPMGTWMAKPENRLKAWVESEKLVEKVLKN